MSPRSALVLTALALSVATPAMAEIRIGHSVFGDRDEQEIMAACRGLEAQARQSLTSDPPDDIDNGDPAGAYALNQLPFTVRDCREAGYW